MFDYINYQLLPINYFIMKQFYRILDGNQTFIFMFLEEQLK